MFYRSDRRWSAAELLRLQHINPLTMLVQENMKTSDISLLMVVMIVIIDTLLHANLH